MALLNQKIAAAKSVRNKGDLYGTESKQEKLKSTFPIISLLLTIAALAATSAYVLYKYTSDRSYRKKWSDYDDCGLA